MNLLWIGQNQFDVRAVDDNFTLFTKIDRDLSTDVGLDLPHTPFGPVRVTDQHARFQDRIDVRHFTSP